MRCTTGTARLGFLAAYNAGPQRVDDYLAGAADLPNETLNYLAAVTPNLGGAVPMSGPWAIYASAGRQRGYAPSVASLAAGCDLNAAYDPNHPCSSLVQAAVASAPIQPALVQLAGVGGCNLDAAYDPSHPCTSVGGPASGPPVEVASAPPQPVEAASAPPQPVEVASAPPPPAVPQQVAANGCDLDASYDPDRPCTAQGQRLAAAAPAQPAGRHPSFAGVQRGATSTPPMIPTHPCRPAQQAASPVQLASADGCDPNAAFDPDRPCRANSAAGPARPPPPIAAKRRPPPHPPPAIGRCCWRRTGCARRVRASPRRRTPGPHLLAIPTRNWAIQVGAFANPALARAVAEGARAQAPAQLRSAALTLPPTPLAARSSIARASPICRRAPPRTPAGASTSISCRASWSSRAAPERGQGAPTQLLVGLLRRRRAQRV